MELETGARPVAVGRGPEARDESPEPESRGILELLSTYDFQIDELMRIVNHLATIEQAKQLTGMINRLSNDLIDEEFMPPGGDDFLRHDTILYLHRVTMGLAELKTDIELSHDENLLADLPQVVARVRKHWLVYRLIMQDVASRYYDGEALVSEFTKQADREKNIHELVGSLEHVCQSRLRGSYHLNLERDSDLENLKISAPHGLVLNLVQNCVVNALSDNVDAKNFLLRLKHVGNEFVISFYDDGMGMTAEQLQKNSAKFVCRKGVSGKGSSGLGLAFADERVRLADGQLIIMSRRKVIDSANQVGYEVPHSFPPVVPVSGEPIELDQGSEQVRRYSTCFQIRVPVIS